MYYIAKVTDSTITIVLFDKRVIYSPDTVTVEFEETSTTVAEDSGSIGSRKV